MFARIAVRPLSLVLLGVLLVLGSVTLSHGKETQLGNADLQREFQAMSPQKRLELISGQRVPQGMEDTKIMETIARYYVWRVTWPSSKTNPQKMDALHAELDQLLTPILGSGAGKNKVFVEQLGKPMAESFREVLKLDFADNRASILNAALMLPPVAKLKQEEIGDLLVEILNDKNRHDAIKLYAAKALREFFPMSMVTPRVDPKAASVKRKLARDSERMKALVDFMERKEQPIPADEGERQALIYMRREAVISLAQAGVPALSALKNDGEVKGPVAYELLRVLLKGKGAYNPPTSIAERVEAALGLCPLKDPDSSSDDPKSPNYDASVAVYAVGLCFLDYMKEYSSDYPNLIIRKKLTNLQEGKHPTLPWRIQSERFKMATKDLVANTLKGSPAYASALKLDREISKIAESMRGFNDVSQQVSAFRDLVATLKPKSGKLYKLKGPEIDVESLAPVGVAAAEEN